MSFEAFESSQKFTKLKEKRIFVTFKGWEMFQYRQKVPTSVCKTDFLVPFTYNISIFIM